MGATRWDVATCEACAPFSSFDVAEARTIAKGPHVASADNTAKWLRALFRQIHFGKACARVDHRACLADGTRVIILDAFEGSQLRETSTAPKRSACYVDAEAEVKGDGLISRLRCEHQSMSRSGVSVQNWCRERLSLKDAVYRRDPRL